MEESFRANIYTPQRTIFEGKVSSLIVPAELGYLGVLANHAPLVANLVPGKITFREISGKVTELDSQEMGFLEVSNNNATVLLDS